MRFRNLVKDRRTGKAAPIYFPYAGDKDGRGREVPANGLSRELPAQRFYDPLLQRDWRLGAIEVLFNEQDKAILGDAIKGLIGEDVEIKPAVPGATETVAVAPKNPGEHRIVRRRGRPRKHPLVEQVQAPVPAPEPVSVQQGPVVVVEAPPVDVPTPAPAETVPQPEPAEPKVFPPVVRPPTGMTIHPAPEVRKGGIPQMQSMPPQQFAGIPPGVGLADLKRQNAALNPPAQPAS